MLCGVETKVLGQFMLVVGQLEKSNIYSWDKNTRVFMQEEMREQGKGEP